MEEPDGTPVLVPIEVKCPRCDGVWTLSEMHTLPYRASIMCPKCEIHLEAVATEADLIPDS